jgi:HK97 family phage prohead protease
MERLTFAVSGGKVEGRTLSGTAHVYGTVTVDGRNHSFAAGAFARSIAAGKVKSFAWHDESKLLGSQKAGTLRLTDGETLGVAIDLPDASYANDMRALTERGEDLGFSFSVIPRASKVVKGVRIFSDAELVSVDPVAMPAFEGTSVILNSQRQSETVISQLTKIRARRLAQT